MLKLNGSGKFVTDTYSVGSNVFTWQNNVTKIETMLGISHTMAGMVAYEFGRYMGLSGKVMDRKIVELAALCPDICRKLHEQIMDDIPF